MLLILLNFANNIRIHDENHTIITVALDWVEFAIISALNFPCSQHQRLAQKVVSLRQTLCKMNSYKSLLLVDANSQMSYGN